jgi:hypothetical protein
MRFGSSHSTINFYFLRIPSVQNFIDNQVINTYTYLLQDVKLVTE